MRKVILTTLGMLAMVGCKTMGGDSAVRADDGSLTATDPNLITAENETKIDAAKYTKYRKFKDDCQVIRDAIRTAPANSTVKVFKHQSGVWKCIGPIAIERSNIMVIGDASRVGGIEVVPNSGNDVVTLFNGPDAPKQGQRLTDVDHETQTNGTFASPQRTQISTSKFVIPALEQSSTCRGVMSKKEWQEQVRIKLAPLVHAPVMVIGTIHAPLNFFRGNIEIDQYKNIVVKNFDLDGSLADTIEPFMMKMSRKDQIETLRKNECWLGQCDDANVAVSAIRSNGLTMRHTFRVLVENVSTHANSSGGFVVEKDSQDLVLKHFEAYGNIFDGFAGYQTIGSWHDDIYLHDNLSSGISIDVIYNNAVFSRTCGENNYDNGIFARYSHGARFFDSYFGNNCNFGAYMSESGPNQTLTDYEYHNVFFEKSGRGFTQANKTGVRIDSPTSSGLIFDRVRFQDNPGGGLSMVAGTYAMVDGQRVDAGAPLNFNNMRLSDECRLGLGETN